MPDIFGPAAPVPFFTMNPKMIILAQIGCGYWGPNLLRNFSAVPNCRVKYLVDTSEERRAFVKSSFPATEAVADLRQALGDAEIDGVIIATPAGTHFSPRHTFCDRRADIPVCRQKKRHTWQTGMSALLKRFFFPLNLFLSPVGREMSASTASTPAKTGLGGFVAAG